QRGMLWWIRGGQDAVGAIRRERGDETVRQAVGNARILLVEGVMTPVIAVQSALRADPHEAVGILGNGGDGVLGQRFAAARALEVEIALGGAGAVPDTAQQH